MKRVQAEKILSSLHEQNMLGEAYNQVEEVRYNSETDLYLVRLSHDERPFHAERVVRLDTLEVLDIPYCASDFPTEVYYRLDMPELDETNLDKLEDLCEEFPDLKAQLRCGLDVVDALAIALRKKP